MGFYYSEILHYLKRNRIEYKDDVQKYITSSNIKSKFGNITELRDYQKEALKSWLNNNKKGCIILPTGAGKTMIALHAIMISNDPTLIVVPTLNLMDQWVNSIKKILNDKEEVGSLGGGEENIKSITVTTYDSAYLKSSYLGNKFKLLIFDEVHHLASNKYTLIGEQFISPYRLGLTATIEREDNKHVDIYRLVGKIVYKKYFDELSEKKYLSKFKVKKISINMLPSEVIQYNKKIHEYKKLLKECNIFYPIKLEKLIILSGNNVKIRKALLLRNESLEIALNSHAKILELEKLLKENTTDKIIIFTVHTKLAYKISNRFLVPVITHKTKNEERNDILNKFKKNNYRVIATTRVLDEGVDVPDANMGIILSGTGSKREFIQRLGRILRPKIEKENIAQLIEIVSSNTTEIFTSYKRNRGLKNINEPTNIQ